MPQPSEVHVIYALTEPDDLEDVRYIGATVNPTNRRLSHNRVISGKSPRDIWIAELRRQKKRYGFRILASVVGGWKERSIAEREVIRQYDRDRPGRILNVADRFPHFSQEYVKRRTESARDEFERIARWAIRAAILRGDLEKPDYKDGWWRHMRPAATRKTRTGRTKLLLNRKLRTAQAGIATGRSPAPTRQTTTATVYSEPLALT